MPHFFDKIHFAGSFLAVDLFFVLSGFVLANAYERRFDAGMSVRQFFRIRIIRLYPLYLLSILLGIGIALLAIRHGGVSVEWSYTLFATTVPLSLVMLPTPKLGASDVIYPLNPVLWSIFFELIVNIVYVAAYRWLRKRSVLVAVIALGGVALVLLTAAGQRLDGGFSWGTLALGAARVTYSFFCGVLLFRLFDPARRRESNLSFVVIAAMLVVFLLSNHWTLQLAAAIALMPAIVWFGACWEPRHGKRVFAVTGAASYALYVLHKPTYQLALGALIVLLPFRPETIAPWIGIAFLTAIFFVSVLVDRWYDLPVRKFLLRRVRGGASAPPQGGVHLSSTVA